MTEGRAGDAPLAGGVDLGGTKIEARLFAGDGLDTVETRRVPTPRDFAAMIAALADAAAWLRGRAGDPALPVGLALPGTLDLAAGTCRAANLPDGGGPVGAALAAAAGAPIPLLNDAAAFALSEAHGCPPGAGRVLGLILGTGLGAGMAAGSEGRRTARSLEVGHLGMPARALARHGLPPLPCGCGRVGCVETYLSGPGLAALAQRVLGRPLPAQTMAIGDPGAKEVLALWTDLAGEGLSAVPALLAPDLIVLGGGLSNMPGIAERLSDGLARHLLPGAALPAIRLAAHGDSSGARGAALVALGKAAPC